MVVAGLPGATPESVRLTVAGDNLLIDTDGGVKSVSCNGRTSPGVSGFNTEFDQKRRARSDIQVCSRVPGI